MTIITQIIKFILTAKTTLEIIGLILYHSPHIQITVLSELFCSQQLWEVWRLSIIVLMKIPRQREWEGPALNQRDN